MKFLLTSLAAAGLSFAAYASMTGSDTAEPDQAPSAAASKAEQFLLHVNGRASDCKLTRLKSEGEVATSAGCGSLHPPMADAARWIYTDDGSVIIAAADGQSLMELAISDGAAYESYNPATPLILLAPAD